MQFFDCWKTLNARFDEGDMTAQTQLVGYKLLAIFNERKFPDWLPVSDRELQSRTNIKSGQTIVAARRALKNAGLIDFDTPKNKPTRYRLTIKHESSTNQARIKHESSTNQAPEGNSYIRVREDVKTLDVKTSPLPTDTTARACAPVNRNSEDADLDAIVDRWQELRFGRLNFEMVSELENLLRKHGFAKVNQAMTEAAESNGKAQGVSFKFFKAVLENTGKPALKASEQREKRAKQPGFLTYQPDPNIVYPWELGGTDGESESTTRSDKAASA